MAALYEFLNRRDTWANWQNNNIVLPEGVLGVIIDSPADELWLLMGDGQTHVKDLQIWKLYQDTVRESKPATLSQLTIKSDGTNAPLIVRDNGGQAQFIIARDGSTVITNLSYINGINGGATIQNISFIGGANDDLSIAGVSGIWATGDIRRGGIWWQVADPAADSPASQGPHLEITAGVVIDGSAEINGDTQVNGGMNVSESITANGASFPGGEVDAISIFATNVTTKGGVLQINDVNGNPAITADAGGSIRTPNALIATDGTIQTQSRVVAPDIIPQRTLQNPAGTTANRPATDIGGVAIKAGYQYFDTNLGKPIWYTGTTWVDGTGAVV